VKNTKLVALLGLITSIVISPVVYAKSDTQKAVTKTGITAGRAVVGTTVGGTVGKVITGGAIGTGIGVILTPSEIGCGKGESCAKGYKVTDK
jgi:hypothetical protein